MPKGPRQYAYKCICAKENNYFVDLGFEDYNKYERDKLGFKNAPLSCKHVIRVFSSDPFRLDRNKNPFPPDYIVTDRPLASHYLKSRVKIISRPRFDIDGRPLVGQRKITRKEVKPKFEEVEMAEVLMAERTGIRVHRKKWTDDLFTELDERQVYRPDLAAAGKQKLSEPEPLEGRPMEEEA